MTGRLHDLLISEVATIDLFIALLEDEAKAMSDGNFAELPKLAARKSALADQIAVLGQQRKAEQLALGYPAGRLGADTASAAGGKELQQAWQALLSRAEVAKERNHRNGVIVRTQLEFMRQTIRFLQADEQPLYGSDGSARTGAGSGKSLASG